MLYVYNYLIAAIILSLVILVCFFRKRNISTKLSNAFAVLVSSILLSALLNLFTVFTISFSQMVPVWINYVVNIAYHLASISIPISFYFCIFSYIESNNIKVSRHSFIVRKVILYATLFISLIIIFSPLNKICFYFDENKVYTHGRFFILPYFVYAAFVIVSEFHIIIYHRLFTTQQKIVIFLYSLFVLGSFVIQVLSKKYLIFEFASSVAALLIYLSLDDPSGYRDKEMDIYNKGGFKIISNRLFGTNKTFTILVIKFSGYNYLSNKIGNNNYKHLMKEISKRIFTCAQTHNIYRISQTKVAVILESKNKNVDSIIEELKDSFAKSFYIEDISILITIRMVKIYCPQDAKNTEETLKIIDYATNSIEKYEPNYILEVNKELVQQRDTELKLINILKAAIRKNEFRVVYQPIYSNNENKFTTAEALIRLDNNELGRTFGPDIFIPLAEKNGLMMRIGEFVFNTVCQFICREKIWEKGVEYIHVNLSTIQCMHENLYLQLLQIMDDYHLNHKYISLEVTETTAVTSSNTLKQNMNNLINNGMHFAIDDFGSGFSNISTLTKYPFKVVKLDKSLIDLITTNDKAKTIVQNTIKMVKSLDMEVVSEGVETQDQIDLLRESGADFIQGYYYSKPLNEQDYVKFLEKNN